MHEIYLAEEIINKVQNEAETKEAEKVTAVRIAIPEDEHYTAEAFEDALKIQAEGTLAEGAKFYVFPEKTDKPYIKDIRIK